MKIPSSMKFSTAWLQRKIDRVWGFINRSRTPLFCSFIIRDKMHTIPFKKYSPNHVALKGIVKNYWFVKTSVPVEVNHALVPVNNCDIILNFGTPIIYSNNGGIDEAHPFHFHGIRKKEIVVIQKGKLDTVGISFTPHGLYEMTNTPMCEFTDRLVSLADVLSDIGVFDSLAQMKCPIQRINAIEKFLLNRIKDIYSYDLTTITKDLSSGSFTRVNHYCRETGISERTLERVFKKHVGISPKSFLKLSRFQKLFSQINSGNYSRVKDSIYDLGFCDQTHFNREFKSYVSNSPSGLAKLPLIKNLFQLD